MRNILAKLGIFNVVFLFWTDELIHMNSRDWFIMLVWDLLAEQMGK